MRRPVLAAVLYSFLWLAGSDVRVSAATISVCDEASLRSALTNGGPIVFDCDGVIMLSQTLLVRSNASLDANGHAVTISGSNQVRVLRVNPGVSLALHGLTIANGLYAGRNGSPAAMDGESASGGGILNEGMLTLMNCTFSNNVARGGTAGFSMQVPAGDGGFARGGAICSIGGAVRSTNCLFVSNASVGGHGSPRFPSVGGFPDGGDAFGGAIFVSGAEYSFYEGRFVRNRAVAGQNTRDNGGGSGSGTGGDGSGGAICFMQATGVVMRSIFSSNQALGARAVYFGPPGSAYGGAITISNGTLHISNSTFSANLTRGGSSGSMFVSPSGPGSGGALMNAGDLRVSASYFVANEATGGTPGYCEGGVTYMPPCEGGAIQNLTTATIEGCTFATNTARGSNGDNTACYFTYESGIGRGGAINNRSNLQVLNSTFAHNVAQGGDYYSGYGGALANSNTLILTHTTIASNSALYGSSAAVADGNGGGIYNNGGSAFLRNSLLSGNVGKNASGFTFDAGHNITSDYLDPRLLPLADYGGPTLTMALAAGSAAIDAAQISHCTPADQRGFSRPYGAGCDIGACEFLPLFSIRGTVTGYLPPGGITVLAGQQSVTTSNGGSYAIVSLMEGTYDVVASGPTVVTVPARQTVNLYADAIGVDFKSYRRNALLVESLCQDMLQITYAGAPSEMHEVQRTLGFEQWLPVLTNTTGTNGLFILSYPPGPTREFFRTRRLE